MLPRFVSNSVVNDVKRQGVVSLCAHSTCISHLVYGSRVGTVEKLIK